MLPPDSHRRFRLLRAACLALIPLTAGAAWFAVQPGDRLCAPESRFLLPALVYDEFDLAAMALRGLNAERDRLPGRADNPYESWYEPPLGVRLASDRPLKRRYFLEYPHAALLLFRVGYWIQPSARNLSIPPALADTDYHDVAMNLPATVREAELWRSFVVASQFYVAVMLVCLLLLMAILEWGYGGGLHGGSLLLLLPAFLYFTLNRYDIVPAMLTALSLACLGRRWHTASGLTLAAAALVKVYPVLLAPLIVRYLWSNRRDASKWSIAFAGGCSLALTPLLFGSDLEAVLAPYRFQLTRPPELGMTIYGCFLPVQLGSGALGAVFRTAVLGGTLAALLRSPILDLTSLLRRGALFLLVFVSVAVFYSPQWVIWFAPLLFPLARTDRRLGWSVITFDLITYLTFPVAFWISPIVSEYCLKEVMPLEDVNLWNSRLAIAVLVVLRFLRFVVIGIMSWQLIRAEWPHILTGSWLARRSPRLAWFLMQKL